ncbi:MAG: NAD-dependent epimerase/dehydratase family protein [Armatimonadota bacterium]
MEKRRVLVTGASGYVASQMLPTLRERYDCLLVDARTTDAEGREIEGIRLADLTRTDYDANRELFRGIDTVVHLAYVSPVGGMGARTPASYYVERTNVDMAFHVYQLSLEEGVRRVVVASSNHAADWYEGQVHAKRRDIVDPWERAVSDNYYGWAKEAYEHLGFVYATGNLGRKLENVQIRIGAPRPIVAEQFLEDPVGYARDLGAYISPRDLTQLFVRSIDADDIRDAHQIPFQIFFGISDNTRKFWSITNARRVVGYEPQDDSEVVFQDGVRRILMPLEGPVPAREFRRAPGTQ